MNARRVAFSFVLALTLAASAFFICYPSWEIEHPADPALVLSSRRSWIWQPPAHAHMDQPGAVMPVLAILVIGVVLGITVRKMPD